MKAIKTISLVAALLAASHAGATVINGNGLQKGLDDITYGNASESVDADFMDVNTSQVGSDQIWALTATGFAANRLLFEFAGNANSNSFGIYDIYNVGNRLQVFSGAASAGAGAVIEGLGNQFSVLGGGSATFTSGAFGYYLSGPGGTFFSQNSLNAGGADQMVAFRGNDELYIDATGFGAGLFSSGEYILAWEDLPAIGGDADYNDFVVMVESVTPVPAPGTLVLLGLALAGFGVSRKRGQL